MRQTIDTWMFYILSESRHADMSDLQHPEFVSSPEDFVKWHRKMLEDEEVSKNLHRWIDLVFGFNVIWSFISKVEQRFFFSVVTGKQQKCSEYTSMFCRENPERTQNERNGSIVRSATSHQNPTGLPPQPRLLSAAYGFFWLRNEQYWREKQRR